MRISDGISDVCSSDLREFEVEGVPQVGRIALMEFKEKGIYHIPREPGDNHGYVYLKDFREDPENNPLPTRSGKLEIRCQVLADHVNRLGWSKIRPIPAYHPALEGYEADRKSVVQGKSVSVRVDHGGRRSMQQQHNQDRIRLSP